MTSVVRVSAPSRIHFGLLRFAREEGASYGGLGMMIDQPRIIIEFQAAPHWQAEGPMAERALAFGKLAMQSCRSNENLSVSMRVCEAPLPHCGLGTGTQLALAIGRGVREVWQLPALEADELAASVDRGKRSAVGSHGFLHGGLIWEVGRRVGDPLGKLARRTPLPEQWRVLLFNLSLGPGLHGERETAAFDRLPPVPTNVIDELQRLAEESILPATVGSDFEAFTEAVHDYGRLSGSCFTTVQGGAFASPAIEQLIDRLRGLGVAGVGQSSWGPTVFAFAADQEQALDLVDRLGAHNEHGPTKVSVAAPDNRGALIEIIAPERDGPAR